MTDLSTYPCVGQGLLSSEEMKNIWRMDFERELREKAIRLLQCRAGGRLSMFEAGMLYQICLAIGMPDSRMGKICEQEEYWNGIVLSCRSEKEAKETLAKLLTQEKVLTRKEKHKTTGEQQCKK